MTFAPILPWPYLATAVLVVLAFAAWLTLPGKQPKQQLRPTTIRAAAVVLLLLAAFRPGWAGAVDPLTRASRSASRQVQA